MLVVKTLSSVATKIIKTGFYLCVVLALSNQARYFAEQKGFIEPKLASDYTIAATYTPSAKGAVQTTVEYCSEIVAVNDSSNSSGITQTNLTFNDSWFTNDSKTYNHEMATTCSILSAVCNSESHYYSDVYGSSAYAEEALTTLGFSNIQTDSYQMRSHTLDQIGSLFSGSYDVAAYAFASKDITSSFGNDGTTLIFIGIRGSYGAEWLSNIKMLNNTTPHFDHKGFKAAEEDVKAALEAYILDIGVNPANIKLLITGHSRGGAIANLLAADFNNGTTLFEDAISTSDVFAYTYASPSVTQNETRTNPRHNNVFNVVNPSDIVCQLPLTSWNYGRYGTVVSLPTTGSYNFETVRNNMQTNHAQNTNYYNPCSTEDLSKLASFEEYTSKAIPNAESLFTPPGAFATLQALYSIDYSKALYVHCPDSYIAWMQALEERNLSFK